MTLELPRRKFLIGLASLIAAPAIVRVSSLMPVRASKIITLQEYTDLIMKSMIDNLQQQICDSIMYGSRYSQMDQSGLITYTPPSEVLT